MLVPLKWQEYVFSKSLQLTAAPIQLVATLGVELSDSGFAAHLLSSWRVFPRALGRGKSDSRRTFPLVLLPFLGVALLPVDGRPLFVPLPPATALFRPLAIVTSTQCILRLLLLLKTVHSL